MGGRISPPLPFSIMKSVVYIVCGTFSTFRALVAQLCAGECWFYLGFIAGRASRQHGRFETTL